MIKLVPLDIDSSVSLDMKKEVFLDPDFIYLPLPKTKQQMKKETNIKRGTEVFEGTFSPVSGKLVNVEKCIVSSGKEVPFLIISNDFQEKSVSFSPTRKRINRLTKEAFLDSFYDKDLKEKFLVEKISTFVISGIDDDPYLGNEIFLQNHYTKLILETIEALLNLFPGSKAILAIKNTDSDLILQYNNFLGMFSNIEIRMMENLYLIGQEEFLIPRLHIKNSYLYLKAHEVYDLYHQIKNRKPVFEKYITITGDAIASSRIVCVKLGTKVLDVLKKFYREDFSACSIYVNGVMQGKVLDLDRLIVTKEFLGIVVMKKKKEKSYSCIKCGKCIQICPIRSNPLLAYKRGKNVRCIHCGLCSYVCPSHIPLDEYLRGE